MKDSVCGGGCVVGWKVTGLVSIVVDRAAG